MTRKLYLEHSYDTSFEAEVVSASASQDGTMRVVLDRTLFYPESGGQLPDSGTLGGAAVCDVQEDASDAVVHVVRAASAPAGKITGAVDWAPRFDHMQQHTGQHVLSRAFIETGGLHTVSFHMGADTCTIDLEGTGFGDAAVRRAEDLANRVIEENRPIDIKTMPVAELDAVELRRKVPAGVSEARIVTVRDFDMIPCCGTHVRATGELGLVKVLKSEKVRATHRVHFKVGLRAIDDYRSKHDIVQSLAARLTTAPGDIAPRIERLLSDMQTGAKRAKQLTQRLADADRQRLLVGAPRHGDIRVLVLRDADADYVRALSAGIQGESRAVAVLGADDGSVVCVASRDLDVDVASGAADIARELGGSGGGKGGFVQLKLPDASQLDELMQRMESHVRARIA